MVLNSGFGEIQCTPGIVSDDISSLAFVAVTSTGVDDLESDNGVFEVYPNPSQGQFTIAMKGFDYMVSRSKVRVFFADGRLVKEIAITGEKEQFNLSKGIYFLQFVDKQNILKTKKLIVLE